MQKNIARKSLCLFAENSLLQQLFPDQTLFVHLGCRPIDKHQGF
jgi:hypothetical protein